LWRLLLKMSFLLSPVLLVLFPFFSVFGVWKALQAAALFNQRLLLLRGKRKLSRGVTRAR
jgi:hypothetical protein